MLSVVVYGRNDNHGYNMHKRIAISLNAIAEVLTHEDDEILYVDYNTSNDLPTVIEAIQDTLTERAKKLTRVFRVRPEIHDRFKNLTHAQVNEPLARNIAIRRSNPKNRWILSSNTDMVFVPLNEQKSLSDIVAKVQDGFYELARFDVPEPLWESLDRKNPADIIAKFKDWGKSLHLNEVVYGNPIILYDAPGDFQLMLRDDIFKINGFDERMILGWHVDSNLCKRMHLLYGKIGSLQDEVYGYHCNHTRMSGWMHSVKRVENSIEKFFEKVDEAVVLGQDKWGLDGEEVEEIRMGFDNTAQFADIVQKMIDPSLVDYGESYYNKNGYDRLCYSTNHILPFLLEQFLNLKRGSKILYIGCNNIMFEKVEEFCENSSNIEKLYYLQTLPHDSKIIDADRVFILNPRIAEKIALEEVNKKIDLIIFDFGVDRKSIIDPLSIEFVRRVFDIQYCLVSEVSCGLVEREMKVISIGTHNTRYYKNIKKFFNPIQNPYCSGIMVGRVVDVTKIVRNSYKERLLKKISGKLNGSFSIFVLMYIVLFGVLSYKINIIKKNIFYSKKRKNSNRIIKKLINNKQLVL